MAGLEEQQAWRTPKDAATCTYSPDNHIPTLNVTSVFANGHLNDWREGRFDDVRTLMDVYMLIDASSLHFCLGSSHQKLFLHNSCQVEIWQHVS